MINLSKKQEEGDPKTKKKDSIQSLLSRGIILRLKRPQFDSLLTFVNASRSHFKSSSEIFTDGSTKGMSGGGGLREARSNKADSPNIRKIENETN